MNFFKMLTIGLLAGMLNGLFGSGGGTIIVPALTIFFSFEQYKAHATAIAIILPITLVSTFFYIQGKYIDFQLAFWVAAGGIIGGIIGAVFLKKIPSNILRIVFGIFMFIAAAKMVL
ncbi:MAG: sulfite exporter TauE/SafE family protein [Deltaproteobacteria bacterium]